jgi:hypothetical protein
MAARGTKRAGPGSAAAAASPGTCDGSGPNLLAEGPAARGLAGPPPPPPPPCAVRSGARRDCARNLAEIAHTQTFYAHAQERARTPRSERAHNSLRVAGGGGLQRHNRKRMLRHDRDPKRVQQHWEPAPELQVGPGSGSLGPAGTPRPISAAWPGAGPTGAGAVGEAQGGAAAAAENRAGRCPGLPGGHGDSDRGCERAAALRSCPAGVPPTSSPPTPGNLQHRQAGRMATTSCIARGQLFWVHCRAGPSRCRVRQI